jgi:hypothetical protein
LICISQRFPKYRTPRVCQDKSQIDIRVENGGFAGFTFDLGLAVALAMTLFALRSMIRLVSLHSEIHSGFREICL